MKIGIRIVITQHYDDIIHDLFEVFNVIEFSDDNPIRNKELLNVIKDNSINLAKTLGIE